MTDDLKALKAENEALRKQIANLENIAKGTFIDHLWEEKSDLDELFISIFGKRPKNGGGAILRWKLQEDIVKELYAEKEGDLEELISRISIRKGLTKKKLTDGYILPLYELKLIKLFVGKDSRDKWQWNADINTKEAKKR
jgi:hypothetical protein